MKPPDFRAMSDAELEQWILSYPDRYDIPGALFEQQRRERLRSGAVERDRHRQILRWTIVAAVAAILAAIAALVTLFR
ncbi:MAG: hypothetical protein ACJ8I9_08875 [Chthoniobacterales bacterium]